MILPIFCIIAGLALLIEDAYLYYGWGLGVRVTPFFVGLASLIVGIVYLIKGIW